MLLILVYFVPVQAMEMTEKPPLKRSPALELIEEGIKVCEREIKEGEELVDDLIISMQTLIKKKDMVSAQESILVNKINEEIIRLNRYADEVVCKIARSQIILDDINSVFIEVYTKMHYGHIGLLSSNNPSFTLWNNVPLKVSPYFDSFRNVEEEIIDLVKKLDNVSLPLCEKTKNRVDELQGWIEIAESEYLDALKEEKGRIDNLRLQFEETASKFNNEIRRLLNSVPHNKEEERSFMAYCLLKARGQINNQT